MKPDLHKFKGNVQRLTAKASPEIPIYFNDLKIDCISIHL
jgi:hypothetical protein